MLIDFGKIDDAPDFKPVPAGKYLAELIKAEESTTEKGDPQWNLTFELLEGKVARRLIFDKLFFTEKALKRVKLVCGRLGIDVSSELELTPELLQTRLVYLDVEVTEYEKDGKMVPTNEVPFAGYTHTEKTVQEREAEPVGATSNGSNPPLPF